MRAENPIIEGNFIYAMCRWYLNGLRIIENNLRHHEQLFLESIISKSYIKKSTFIPLLYPEQQVE